MEEVDNMREQMDNVNREMESLRKNQKDAKKQKCCDRNEESFWWAHQQSVHYSGKILWAGGDTNGNFQNWAAEVTNWIKYSRIAKNCAATAKLWHKTSICTRVTGTLQWVIWEPLYNRWFISGQLGWKATLGTVTADPARTLESTEQLWAHFPQMLHSSVFLMHMCGRVSSESSLWGHFNPHIKESQPSCSPISLTSDPLKSGWVSWVVRTPRATGLGLNSDLWISLWIWGLDEAA